MPEALVVVTGTATEIGKTWVCARIATELRSRGVPVAARKPAMSFDQSDTESDSSVLARATGEDETAVCPAHRRYERALAPPMAADALGRSPILVDDLVAELNLPEDAVVLIEGAGGVRSPLAHDGDVLDLADRLGPDLMVLVAPSALGAINDVLTSLDAISGRWPVVVYLNHFAVDDEVRKLNLEWLRARGITVAIDPAEVIEHVLRARATNLGGAPHSVEVT